jgi:hypothetical protein
MKIENVRIEKAANGFILRYQEEPARNGYNYDPDSERCFVYGNIAALLGAIEELYK